MRNSAQVLGGVHTSGTLQVLLGQARNQRKSDLNRHRASGRTQEWAGFWRFGMGWILALRFVVVSGSVARAYIGLPGC